MISITRSTASPPICNPQLPPATAIGAGALQPDLVRQVATPLPWFPPIPRPTLSIEGTTAIHFASPRTLSGIPLSGADMISFKTFAALSKRLAMSDLSLSSAAHVVLARISKHAHCDRVFPDPLCTEFHLK